MRVAHYILVAPGRIIAATLFGAAMILFLTFVLFLIAANIAEDISSAS